MSSQLDEPAASEPTTKKPAEKNQPSQTEKREQHQPQTKSGMPEYDIFSLMDYTQSDVFFDEGERVEDPVSLAPQTDFIEPRTSQNGEPAEKPVFKVSEPQPQEKAPEKAPKLKETPAIQEPAAPQAVQILLRASLSKTTLIPPKTARKITELFFQDFSVASRKKPSQTSEKSIIRTGSI